MRTLKQVADRIAREAPMLRARRIKDAEKFTDAALDKWDGRANLLVKFAPAVLSEEEAKELRDKYAANGFQAAVYEGFPDARTTIEFIKPKSVTAG